MKKLFNQSGQAFIFAVLVLVLVTLGILTLATGAFTFKSNTKYNLDKLDASNLAEAGIDKAVATFNTNASNYNGEAETQLGSGTYEVSITTVNSSTKLIQSTGYVPNKASAKTKKTVSIQLSKGDGYSFSYGVQVGQGGLVMHNNSKVTGSVYSNGNIIMDNGSKITGDAYVAGGIQPDPDQSSSCSAPNCANYLFGKIANQQLDIAQGFKPSVTNTLNKISLNLKKVGNPSDITVRILADDSGKPSKNNVLASGTLYASLVSTSGYNYVDIAFSSPPNLTAGTSYWIVLDTAASSTNYWYWSQDTLQGYTPLGSYWSDNWQAGNPDWNAITGDFDFKTYMGGVATSITGANTPIIGGNAYANTLTDLNITGSAHYQVATNITAGSLYPNSPDPAMQVMPISESTITEWKDTAEANDVQTGDITECTNLASKKYVGNISLTNNCYSTAQSPIYITGNLFLDNGSYIKLDNSYGASSGVIVVDGTITLHNNAQLKGSGTTGSYMMGLSNYDSTVNGETAIDSDNGSTSSILYANKGIIFLHNNASLTEITGWKIILDNTSNVVYTQGLSSTFFSSGPTGSYSVIKGTYQSK